MTENIRQRCLIGFVGPIYTVPLTVFLLLESFLLKRTQLVQAGSFLSELLIVQDYPGDR
jgi:NhaP-type Na+/H+ or K+/H+ antiporter